jgi:glycine hydroxymethyltransferase
MGNQEMRIIARWISEALDKRSDEAALARIRGHVRELADSFPLYDWLREPQLTAAH